ncbi:MAG TPA: hypothetical protein DDY13_01405 [Cytophagales bacterium]|nr:hypothetical protein [Cytophagales bacterium]
MISRGLILLQHCLTKGHETSTIFHTYLFFGLNSNAQHFKVGLQKNDKSYISTSMTRFPVPLNQMDLPDHANLKSFCPSAGNQIQLNTFPAWAAAYSAMTIMWAKNQNFTNAAQIARSAFSPIFVYYQATGGNPENCGRPVWLPAILDEMVSFGSVRYTNYLEFCPESMPDSLLQQARTNRIQGYQRLFHLDDNYDTRLLAIKAVLANGKPVVAGIHAPPSFQTASKRWQPREPMSDKWPMHAIAIMGYNDQKYGGAFEVLYNWEKSGVTMDFPG